MLISFPNQARKNIMVVDVEFDEMKILQAAGMIFTRKKGDLYELVETFDFYILRDKIGKYARRHSRINLGILKEKGIEEASFVKELNSILTKYDLEDSVFVSHGTRNDRKILRNLNIELPAHSYCTYRNAMKILGRDSCLKLKDIAAEAGLNQGDFHDALFDVVATVIVLSFLENKREWEDHSFLLLLILDFFQKLC